MKKVTIIGFGRFGKTLRRLLGDDFHMTVYSRNKKEDQSSTFQNTLFTSDLDVAYESDVIFFSVPISEFESVVKSHKKYFKESHLLIDVLSVKVHPSKVFEECLKDLKTQAILTHPMFGPDSSRNGFDGLPIILNNHNADKSKYDFWKKYFENKKLKVIEMTPEEHDRIAANTQGLTHFVGRLLEDIDFQSSQIDSVGSKKLMEIKEQTCNDTWQLFSDLQTFNPFTKSMRLKLGESYDKLYNKLLPINKIPGVITYGIQGGKGSFNEEALIYSLSKNKITNYQISYLYTSENVMRALHEGDIDIGQFATHNSVGGIVDESVEAMAKYKFKILEKFAIKIAHAVMIRKDVDFANVKKFMAHPQVFAQCKKTLSQKYPNTKLISGEGEMIDHALVAKSLSEGKMEKNIAVMGSKVLAKIYDLVVVDDNLQDAKENYTSFLHVGRI